VRDTENISTARLNGKLRNYQDKRVYSQWIARFRSLGIHPENFILSRSTKLQFDLLARVDVTQPDIGDKRSNLGRFFVNSNDIYDAVKRMPISSNAQRHFIAN